MSSAVFINGPKWLSPPSTHSPPCYASAGARSCLIRCHTADDHPLPRALCHTSSSCFSQVAALGVPSSSFRRRPATPPARPTFARCSSHGQVSAMFEMGIADTTTRPRMIEVLKEKIREALPHIKMPVSPFDTAWVAMVPSQTSPGNPCFPTCLEWIMENQNQDGSWSLPINNRFLMKDTLSSTLACVLALKCWGIEDKHLKKGINFVQANSSFAINDEQFTPIGFNVIFLGMLQQANKLGLKISISKNILDNLKCAREKELESGSQSNDRGWKKYLAYVAEGFVHNYNWEELWKYQKSNGSFFNSPSTTATMLIHTWNVNAFEYLSSLVRKFGNAVPSIYPTDILVHLSMVDFLDKVGIAHYFSDYIGKILNRTYLGWLDHFEDIQSDLFIRALAFRLLRVHGYDVHPSGLFTQPNQDELLNNSVPSNLRDILTLLELYKASQLKISEDEKCLGELNSRCSHLLKQSISKLARHNDLENAIVQEIDYTLDFPFYAILNRLYHRRHIQAYHVDSNRCLKAPFFFEDTIHKNILELATEDFNFCQSQFQTEFHFLDRWVREARLDQLKFSRQKQIYGYFTASSTTFPAEMVQARISWAKNTVLTTIIDDYFDVGVSRVEMINLVDLIRRWDANYTDLCCSDNVYIMFSSIYNSVMELGAIASSIHGYCVTSHLIETWLDVATSMMHEAEWGRNGTLPTMDQYMAHGLKSLALGPTILSTTYFVGSKLSWDIVRSSEYRDLFGSVSTFGRSINDIQGFEREGSQGKINSVSLRMFGGDGSLTRDEAMEEVRQVMDASGVNLFRLLVQEKGSVVPRPCKNLFWNMYRILAIFYAKNDGFSSPTEMMARAKSVIFEPITISCS